MTQRTSKANARQLAYQNLDDSHFGRNSSQLLRHMPGQGLKKEVSVPSEMAPLSSVVAFRSNGNDDLSSEMENQVLQDSLIVQQLSHSEGAERGCFPGLKPVRGTSPFWDTISHSHPDDGHEVLDSSQKNASRVLGAPEVLMKVGKADVGEKSVTEHYKQKKRQTTYSNRNESHSIQINRNKVEPGEEQCHEARKARGPGNNQRK